MKQKQYYIYLLQYTKNGNIAQNKIGKIRMNLAGQNIIQGKSHAACGSAIPDLKLG